MLAAAVGVKPDNLSLVVDARGDASEAAGWSDDGVDVGSRDALSENRDARANQRVHDAERMARRWHRHCRSHAERHPSSNRQVATPAQRASV